MTLDEAKTRLNAVRKAINDAIIAGGMTGYSIRGRSKQVDLQFLREEEDRLESHITMLTDGGSTTVARFVRV